MRAFENFTAPEDSLYGAATRTNMFLESRFNTAAAASFVFFNFQNIHNVSRRRAVSLPAAHSDLNCAARAPLWG